MHLRLLLMAAALAAGSVAGAGPLASYRDGDLSVMLRTEPCAADGQGGGGRRASRSLQGRLAEGCWTINERGNPVVAWEGEGPVQELDGARFRFEPRYAALLQPGDPPDSQEPEVPGGQQDGSFPRPAWCKDASTPHERQVCRDRELSAEDLQLGRLWQAYRDRMKLSRAEQRRHKDEFYRRLKACGADRECIAGEQAARIRFYRDALGLD